MMMNISGDYDDEYIWSDDISTTTSEGEDSEGDHAVNTANTPDDYDDDPDANTNSSGNEYEVNLGSLFNLIVKDAYDTLAADDVDSIWGELTNMESQNV